MKKKLPVGMSNFKKIIEENYYFVDKSLFIKDIIGSGEEVILFPRPRRFGKTLNMSMLKCFLDINNKDENRKLFKNLKIEKEEIMDKQGKYPVIYMSFKDTSSKSLNGVLERIKRIVAGIYDEYDYLLEKVSFSDRERDLFIKIKNLEADEIDYGNSIKFLSKKIFEYHNEKVVILIDEYDNALNSSFISGFYDELIDFFKKFLGAALKDNDYLQKGVITGILKVAKASIFSELNNLDVYTILDKEFSDYFGLLKEEVEEIIDYYDLEFEKNEIENWYNGYNFGNKKLYNPFSIISLANRKGELKPYWFLTSGNEIIVELTKKADIQLKEKINKLIKGEEVIELINSDIIYSDVYNDISNIWSFLLFTGYLVWDKKETGKFLSGESEYYSLKIPNEETRRFYLDVVIKWFDNAKGTDLLSVFQALVDNEPETFKMKFKKIAIQNLSYYDVGREPESFYHAFVLGMVVQFSNYYDVESNRESGLGRYDISLTPKDRKSHGIILEFKVAKDNETILEAAEAAIKQIKDKSYISLMNKYNLKSLILGIGFKGKEVEILYEESKWKK